LTTLTKKLKLFPRKSLATTTVKPSGKKEFDGGEKVIVVVNVADIVGRPSGEASAEIVESVIETISLG
jgi:hypothetical protein